jgi:glycine oxidase
VNSPGIAASRPDVALTFSDVLILGGGVIGLSLALELRQRGRAVILLERDRVGRGASHAAAGMLAAADSENHPALSPLSDLSLALYPAFLKTIADVSGINVPFHTSQTLLVLDPGQHLPPNSSSIAESTALSLVPQLSPHLAANGRLAWLSEHSLDPRELCAALRAACLAAGVDIRQNEPVLAITQTNSGISARTPSGQFVAPQAVVAAGAWSAEIPGLPPLPIEPRKGHMLVLANCCQPPLSAVIRSRDVYFVPRPAGAGHDARNDARNDARILIGATVERSGFDSTIDQAALARLHSAASALVPALASIPQLDSWIGFRPGTPDDLPILGALASNHLFAATGHFRNGILLAPATAHLMAQLLSGESPSISLDAFSPNRFTDASTAPQSDNHSIATL